MKHLKWSADFETTTDENDCRVWAYSLSSIDDPEVFLYGNSIEDFMDWCCNPKENYTLYFFNLKFDGAFIISWLLKNGFNHVLDKKERGDGGTFTTLITDTGQFYSIEIYFEVNKHHVNKVKILDAMKIFPNFSVERIAEGFNLPIKKLELDYKKTRPVGWEITPEEVDYIRNDVEIVARALHEMFERGLTKMTIASNAMSFYKGTIKGFRRFFPILPEKVDAVVRDSYKGGFTYCNPTWCEKEVRNGMTLDVNSLYPAQMKYQYLPYDNPIYFEGKYQPDPLYNLYVQVLTCKFTVKKGKIPSIQIRNNLSFIPNEYLESSKDEVITLTLTSVDLELFFEQYDVDPEFLTYEYGYKFRSRKGLFDNYIDYWTEQKIKAGKEGNASQRQIAKLMLNSLSGKFGLSIHCRKKAPVLTHEGIVRYITLPEETREPCYIPVIAFVTAYGRAKTIRTSQAIRDYSMKKYGRDAHLYCDTDSIHCLLSDEDLEELKDIIDVDDYRLGAWAKEAEFTRALFIRQKCYIEEIEGKTEVTVAGLPKYLAPLINFDNFRKGFTTMDMDLNEMVEMAKQNGAGLEDIAKLHHKLTYKYVQGGVILADTDFTIK